MLAQIDLQKILFLDIETVAQQPDFDSLSKEFKKHWEHKSQFIGSEDQTPSDTYERAGIYAEFGKIACISVGFLNIERSEKTLRIKSYYGENEQELLIDFFNLLNNYYTRQDQLLCAHNGKEFDYPYICRRALVNGLQIPKILDISGKKPWEVQHLDTMQLWKFGDYKNFTSLSLLSTIFGIPTPKDDIDGSMVNQVYWKEKNVERIATYCQKDVIALVQLFLKYRNESLIEDNKIIFTK